jgi:hypothetical protein
MPDDTAAWVTSVDLEATAYGTHATRRTKVTQIYEKTSNLRAVQLSPDHTKLDSTVSKQFVLGRDFQIFLADNPISVYD